VGTEQCIAGFPTAPDMLNAPHIGRVSHVTGLMVCLMVFPFSCFLRY
jgi:hypothetical protein